MNLDDAIRKVAYFPKKGITFYDVTSIFTNPAAFNYVNQSMLSAYQDIRIDGVIAIEARGFLLGALLATSREIPLVLARKKGKLPGETIEQSYALEYGEATLEMHVADIQPQNNYLIVDDLIATGGTVEAVAKMVHRCEAQVCGVFGIIGLPFLNYDAVIGKYNVRTLITYDSE